MEWRSLKFLLASTVAVVAISQIAKKVYKMCRKKYTKITKRSDEFDGIIDKKELNDIIVFPDTVYPEKNHINPGQDKYKKLISYIRSTQETLDICMYLITTNEMADHVIRLGRKQVIIRIIVDDEMSHNAASQIKRLMEYSFIKVQYAKSINSASHKFCVIDGPCAVKRKYKLINHAQKLHKELLFKEHTLKHIKPKHFTPFIMTGSLNWNNQGLLSCCDNVIITSQPQIVNKFEREFLKHWQECETTKICQN